MTIFTTDQFRKLSDDPKLGSLTITALKHTSIFWSGVQAVAQKVCKATVFPEPHLGQKLQTDVLDSSRK
jgi:hypothetical protein